MKFCRDMHDSQRLYHIYFGNPLTLSVAPRAANIFTFVVLTEMSNLLVEFQTKCSPDNHVHPKMNVHFDPLTRHLSATSFKLTNILVYDQTN